MKDKKRFTGTGPRATLIRMKAQKKITIVLQTLSFSFLALSAAFVLKVGGGPARLAQIALVDAVFTSNATVRVSYTQLISAKADLSDFDCYTCHERNKPPPLGFDALHNLIIPKEHSDIVMGHG